MRLLRWLRSKLSLMSLKRVITTAFIVTLCATLSYNAVMSSKWFGERLPTKNQMVVERLTVVERRAGPAALHAPGEDGVDTLLVTLELPPMFTVTFRLRDADGRVVSYTAAVPEAVWRTFHEGQVIEFGDDEPADDLPEPDADARLRMELRRVRGRALGGADA